MNRTKLGIIGKPLGHSLSPILHLKGMEKLNISYSYEKWEIEPFVAESFNGKVTVNPKLFERNY